jgi:hypothetical protein
VRFVPTLVIVILLGSSVLLSDNYYVGPDKDHENIGDVPWENLMPGDSVLIYPRDEAYKEKWVICRVGTEAEPIVVKGIIDAEGNLPVIDGRNATTRPELNFWNEERGVIKIGGANKPADTTPEYIILENLDIRSGRPPFKFSGRNGETSYVKNCAAVYIEKGKHIVVRNCILHDCGNGLFSGGEDIVVEYTHIYDNGIEESWYEHNNYTEADGILFQYNYFGPLRDACDGNNLKDRSRGTIIRYNFIEDGNRQLDLVDTGKELFYTSEKYRSTFVYGNILTEHDGEGNSQIIHYGGDSGDEIRYRKGTLYLHHNTIISYRPGNATLVRLSSEDETCDARNNIIYTIASGNKFAMIGDQGTLNLRNNFIKPDWVISHGNTDGTVNTENNIGQNDPGFVNFDETDFHLSEESLCVNSGAYLDAKIIEEYSPQYHYIHERLREPRKDIGMPDIGAYAYDIPAGIKDISSSDNINIYPHPVCDELIIKANSADKIEVLNVNGKILKTISTNSADEIRIDCRAMDLIPGVYFVRIYEFGGVVKTGKFVFVGR